MWLRHCDDRHNWHCVKRAKQINYIFKKKLHSSHKVKWRKMTQKHRRLTIVPFYFCLNQSYCLIRLRHWRGLVPFKTICLDSNLNAFRWLAFALISSASVDLSVDSIFTSFVYLVCKHLPFISRNEVNNSCGLATCACEREEQKKKKIFLFSF